MQRRPYASVASKVPALSSYATLVFDCDGVLLDSNRVKTAAFRQVTLVYGHDVAETFVDYHVRNGGVSRYKKFEHLFSSLLQRPPAPGEMESMLEAYALAVREGLLSCPQVEGLQRLRHHLPMTRWLVVSGGDQAELRSVFAARGLAPLFDGGIHGSPIAKDAILAREIEQGGIRRPALFIGDSRFDHVCAREAGLDFVFVSRWSEFSGWREYCRDEAILSVEDLPALVRLWGRV